MPNHFLANNLWWDTAGPPLETRPLVNDKTVDVVVIGGGFTGLVSALRLAEKGSNVILLEAHEIGYGGSGRNAGLVNAGLWMEPDKVEATMGTEAGKKLNEILEQGPELVFSYINKHQISCELTRTGTLHCAHSLHGLAQLKKRLQQYQARGLAVELLSAQETAAKIGTNLFHGALWRRDVGTIQPLAYARGLARAAITAGACLYQQTPVTSIERKEAMWHVKTARHVIQTNAIILATNAYHHDLHTSGSPNYVPLHYFQMATRPLPAEILKHILPERQGCWDTAPVMSSFRRDAAGRLIIGSIGSLGNITIPIHHHWAQHSLRKFFPYLKEVEFEYTWVGRIATTADHLPRIINFGPNALSIFGYNGRGIAPGSVFGKAAADFLLTGDERELPIKPVTSYAEKFIGLKQAYYDLGAMFTHLISR